MDALNTCLVSQHCQTYSEMQEQPGCSPPQRQPFVGCREGSGHTFVMKGENKSHPGTICPGLAAHPALCAHGRLQAELSLAWFALWKGEMKELSEGGAVEGGDTDPSFASATASCLWLTGKVYKSLFVFALDQRNFGIFGLGSDAPTITSC